MGTAFSYGLNGDGFFKRVEWWTAFSTGLNGDGFFGWVEWGRLFQMSWMGTAFSYELNGDAFFHTGWMRTAFSYGLNEDGFFIRVEWGRLFQMGWMGTAFSYKLNENHFSKWVEWKRLLRMRSICSRFRAQRVVRAFPVVNNWGISPNKLLHLLIEFAFRDHRTLALICEQ
jgi:hypothetical protein